MIFVSFIAKCTKHLLCIVLTFIALVLLIVSLGLFTHAGNLLVFKSLHEFEPRLTIDLTSGSILNSPEYEEISWRDGDNLYEFKQLSYDFDWTCLIDEVCLDSLELQSANINIAPSETSTPESEETSEPFVLNFPIAVDIKHLDVNNITIKVAGVEVDVKKVLLVANGNDSDVNLNSTISGLTVILPDSKAEPVNTQNNQSAALEKHKPVTNFPPILTDKSLPEVVLPFNLTTEKLEIVSFKLVQDKKDIFVVNQANSKFTYMGSHLAIDKLYFDIPEGDLDLKGAIDLSKRYPMDINATVNINKIKQLQPVDLLKGQRIKLHTKGNLGGLNSTILLTNLINASIENKIDLYSENLPHQLSIEWKKLNWPLKGKTQVETSEGKISSKGKLNDYLLNVVTHYTLLDLPAGTVNLHGRGNLQSLTLSELLINTLQGELLLTGKLDWVEQLTWLGNLNIKHINTSELNKTYPAVLNGDIKQSVTVQLNESKKPTWAFDFPLIKLNGTFLKRALSVDGTVTGDANKGIKISALNIINANNKIVVNGKVADKNDLIATIDIKDLSKVVVGSAGKVKGSISLTGSIDKTEVNTKLTATNLAYLENTIEQVTIQGKTLLAQLPIANVKLNAKNIISHRQKIDSVSVNIAPDSHSNNEVKHIINFDVKSKPVTTDLAIFFTQQPDNWEAGLNTGLIKSAQGSWTLEKPFTVTVKKDTVNLTPHCWHASNQNSDKNGKACIDKFVAGKDGDIKIHIEDFLIATLAPFVPEALKLEGALDADVSLLWKNNQKPKVDLNIDGKEIALNIEENSDKNKWVRYPVDQLHFEINSDQQKANFYFMAVSEGLIDANFKGNVTPYQRKPGIDAKFNLLLPNFDAFSVLIPHVDALTGQLKADIDIHGKVAKPKVEGQVLIADTSMKAPLSPIQVDDLNATIDIHENNAKIDGYFFTNNKKASEKKHRKIVNELVSLKESAINTINIPQRIAHVRNEQVIKKDGNGRADIKGSLDWTNKFKGNVNFKADNMRIQDYGKVELYVSPDINIVFDDSVTVEGELHVDKGMITIKELPEGAVQVSKDVIVVDAKRTKTSAGIPIKMNVKISLGERLRIKAIGLDTYVHGNLLVRKKLTKDLTLNGELTFSQGSYRALAQELVLQNSRIIFRGPPDSPYISIEAIRDPRNIEDNVTAGVRVTGTPDQLKLTVFSYPAMSQQNALSYITRGRSIENSQGESNSQIAALVIDIGAGKTDGTMNDLGKQVGINDLSLAASGQGDEQSIGVRGTIAPGVEVSYGVGVFETFTVFAIRYELFKKFYIEASNGLYQAVDVYYEWDWD
ncbi:translocation/assembly module TamB [Psychromonas sp. RZ22]|uniref:translocation/assembly module TamB domain-containing protein n=1 Tax=Psychromonas algarum TaxID=2555643 RepID=UPI0010673B6A|nr:translocation/assembly module TamB domain-containing protein [Psychromonas sp. RZ22]TEW55236.1 translocation/assembly module TamB [Psychromonas sp. RZ22]